MFTPKVDGFAPNSIWIVFRSRHIDETKPCETEPPNAKQVQVEDLTECSKDVGLGMWPIFAIGVVSPGLFRFTEMCSGSEAGSYLRLIDSCISQLKVQGPSRTCNESKEEEE